MIVLEALPIGQDALRLRSEFLDMPGLALSVPQTARLLGVRFDYAAEMLAQLECEGFLCRDDDGRYRRPPRA